MKANEYFKKHGYKKCKAACAQNGWLNTGFWIQLKRLIESHDLVEYMGGIDKAKEQAYVLAMEVDGFNPAKIEKAISDVESCQ